MYDIDIDIYMELLQTLQKYKKATTTITKNTQLKEAKDLNRYFPMEDLPKLRCLV